MKKFEEKYIEEDSVKELLNLAKNDSDKRKVKVFILKNNCLARYRDLSDNTFSALEQDRLYFSTALGYNDPYDTLMYVNRKKLFAYIVSCLNSGMDEYAQKLKDANPFWGDFASFLRSDKNPKKDEFEKNFFENISHKIDDVKKKLHDNIKGICFSGDFLSTLMWSHYAKNHTGMALLYDRKELVNSECYDKDNNKLKQRFTLEKIRYSDKRVDATGYINDYLLKQSENNVLIQMHIPEPSRMVLKDIILTKDKAWSYENEVRLIPRKLDFETESDIVYLSIKPKGIILGAKMKENEKKRVKRIADSKGIQLYEAWLNEEQRDFNIVFKEYGL